MTAGARVWAEVLAEAGAGGRPRLPHGTEATVRAGWFPEA